MKEEIDLRPYLEALLRRWYWIAAFAVLAALVAYALSSLAPTTYRATALVAVTRPRQVVLASLTSEGVDPQLLTVEDNSLPLQIYPELATSDELLSNLLQQLDSPSIRSLSSLREIVEVETGTDGLLRLAVRHSDAGEAARIANTWAQLFVTWTNQIYGLQGDEQASFFESQLEQARVGLETAEGMLVEFQARNRFAIISNELASLNQTQAGYLADQQAMTFLIRDIEGLRTHLAEQTDSSSVNFADQLTSLYLQIKAFNAETSVPLQLQFTAAEPLTGGSKSEQIAFLDSLVHTMQTKSAEVEARLAELEPPILELQQQQQEIQIESDRLVRDRDMARETYTALARKLEEVRISSQSQDTSSGVRLASRAAVPAVPEGPRLLVSAVLAGALGLVFAAFITLAITWWREGQEEQVAFKKETRAKRAGQPVAPG